MLRRGTARGGRRTPAGEPAPPAAPDGGSAGRRQPVLLAVRGGAGRLRPADRSRRLGGGAAVRPREPAGTADRHRPLRAGAVAPPLGAGPLPLRDGASVGHRAGLVERLPRTDVDDRQPRLPLDVRHRTGLLGLGVHGRARGGHRRPRPVRGPERPQELVGVRGPRRPVRTDPARAPDHVDRGGARGGGVRGGRAARMASGRGGPMAAHGRGGTSSRPAGRTSTSSG